MFALRDDIAGTAVSSAIRVCWRQWRSLAAAGLPVGERPATSIIDPEALVLLALAVRSHERRLDDQLRWWVTEASSLMSVQRTRTLLADYPPRLRQQVAGFAAMGVKAGDQRWKALLDDEAAPPSGRPGKGPRELRLLEPSTLMLRLRAGFGVGAKADLLTFLIGAASATGEHTAWSTTEVIAKAISYSVASTRRAASDMVLARLVENSADRPTRYSVNVPAWAHLLQLRDPFRLGYQPAAREARAALSEFDVPSWRFWAQMFAFLTACAEIGEDARLQTAAPVVQASHLRDLAMRFRRPLGWNGIEWLDPQMFPGELYLEAFKRTLDGVVAWIDSRA